MGFRLDSVYTCVCVCVTVADDAVIYCCSPMRFHGNNCCAYFADHPTYFTQLITCVYICEKIKAGKRYMVTNFSWAC